MLFLSFLRKKQASLNCCYVLFKMVTFLSTADNFIAFVSRKEFKPQGPRWNRCGPGMDLAPGGPGVDLAPGGPGGPGVDKAWTWPQLDQVWTWPLVDPVDQVWTRRGPGSRWTRRGPGVDLAPGGPGVDQVWTSVCGKLFNAVLRPLQTKSSWFPLHTCSPIPTPTAQRSHSVLFPRVCRSSY